MTNLLVWRYIGPIYTGTIHCYDTDDKRRVDGKCSRAAKVPAPPPERVAGNIGRFDGSFAAQEPLALTRVGT